LVRSAGHVFDDRLQPDHPGVALGSSAIVTRKGSVASVGEYEQTVR
jgi:hypothetical protein